MKICRAVSLLLLACLAEASWTSDFWPFSSGNTEVDDNHAPPMRASLSKATVTSIAGTSTQVLDETKASAQVSSSRIFGPSVSTGSSPVTMISNLPFAPAPPPLHHPHPLPHYTHHQPGVVQVGQDTRSHTYVQDPSTFNRIFGGRPFPLVPDPPVVLPLPLPHQPPIAPHQHHPTPPVMYAPHPPHQHHPAHHSTNPMFHNSGMNPFHHGQQGGVGNHHTTGNHGFYGGSHHNAGNHGHNFPRDTYFGGNHHSSIYGRPSYLAGIYGRPGNSHVFEGGHHGYLGGHYSQHGNFGHPGTFFPAPMFGDGNYPHVGNRGGDGGVDGRIFGPTPQAVPVAPIPTPPAPAPAPPTTVSYPHIHHYHGPSRRPGHFMRMMRYGKGMRRRGGRYSYGGRGHRRGGRYGRLGRQGGRYGGFDDDAGYGYGGNDDDDVRYGGDGRIFGGNGNGVPVFGEAPTPNPVPNPVSPQSPIGHVHHFHVPLDSVDGHGHGHHYHSNQEYAHGKAKGYGKAIMRSGARSGGYVYDDDGEYGSGSDADDGDDDDAGGHGSGRIFGVDNSVPPVNPSPNPSPTPSRPSLTHSHGSLTHSHGSHSHGKGSSGKAKSGKGNSGKAMTYGEGARTSGYEGYTAGGDDDTVDSGYGGYEQSRISAGDSSGNEGSSVASGGDDLVDNGHSGSGQSIAVPADNSVPSSLNPQPEPTLPAHSEGEGARIGGYGDSDDDAGGYMDFNSVPASPNLEPDPTLPTQPEIARVDGYDGDTLGYQGSGTYDDEADVGYSDSGDGVERIFGTDNDLVPSSPTGSPPSSGKAMSKGGKSMMSRTSGYGNRIYEAYADGYGFEDILPPKAMRHVTRGSYNNKIGANGYTSKPHYNYRGGGY